MKVYVLSTSRLFQVTNDVDETDRQWVAFDWSVATVAFSAALMLVTSGHDTLNCLGSGRTPIAIKRSTKGTMMRGVM